MIKEYTGKEILDKLPSGWHQVKLQTYLDSLLKVKVIDKDEVDDVFLGIENSISVASVYLDLDVDIIRSFPISLIREINLKLSFLNKKPAPLKKTKYKWIKEIEEPTYDTFILYLRVSELLRSGDYTEFPTIVKNICLDTLTKEQVLELPMDEVETGFFLLRKCLMKSLNSIAMQHIVKLKKDDWKKRISTLFKRT